MTRRVCIIGHPVAHSRSPMLHGYWLKRLGIDGVYTREDVTPEHLASFIRNLRERGYTGANITVPHKEAMLDLVDAMDATSRAVGAINTVWFEGDRLQGANTDVHGFLANLDAEALGWDKQGGTAIVLGAGGASRAVIYGLIQRGFTRIVILNRTVVRGQELVNDFGSDAAVADGWETLPSHLPNASLLVNATSLGMTGKPPLEIALEDLPVSAVVTDLVYTPLETELLAAARLRGNRVVDGLGMLLHQAVPGFAAWFGVTPEVTTALRDLIVADLTGRKTP